MWRERDGTFCRWQQTAFMHTALNLSLGKNSTSVFLVFAVCHHTNTEESAYKQVFITHALLFHIIHTEKTMLCLWACVRVRLCAVLYGSLCGLLLQKFTVTSLLLAFCNYCKPSFFFFASHPTDNSDISPNIITFTLEVKKTLFVGCYIWFSCT